MTAVALAERPMVDEDHLISSFRAAEHAAASEAVRDVPDELKGLGATEKQAQALAEAMRLVLLGFRAQARTTLLEGDYPRDSVDGIMQQLEIGLQSAA